MMTEFIAVIISIAVWWCGLFAVFSGLGFLGRRAFGLPVQSAEAWILSFWSGWAFAILILQLWHLWLKIDGWAFACILILGSGGLLWNRRDLWHMIRTGLLRNSWLVIILLLMALWIANRAIAPIQNGDTGLYHMQSVKWAASYPIIPGLGNLHGRLAFNSSFFLYAAMLGVGPWVQQSHNLANGLLCFVLLTQLFLSLREILLGCLKYHSYHVFNVLFLAPALGQIFSPSFVSLTPDISIFILGTVLITRFYYFFTNCTNDNYNENFDVFLIITLCIVGTTVKLTFIPLGGSVVVIVLAAWFYRNAKQDRKEWKKAPFWILLVNIVLLGLWVVRGVILSGYIAFPYTLGSVPVAWRVPRPLALSYVNWTYSWARAPGRFWIEVLGNWNWFWPWLKNFPYEYTKPLITGLLAIILYLMTMPRILHNSPRRNHTHLLIIVPPFIAVICWFFSAPDPRFSGACFWMFGAGFTALAIDRIGMYNSKIIRSLGCMLCILLFVYLFPSYDSLFVLPSEQDGPFYRISRPEYTTVAIDNLIDLNLPTKTDQCWDIPIPCTPYYRPTIHLRRNSLYSGFMLDDSFTFADGGHGSIPGGVHVSPGIGVALMGGAWFDFQENEHIRWMRTPGTILVYTEHATHVKLTLKPFVLNVHGRPQNNGQLKISLNNASNTELTLKSGVITEAVLGLRPDFNIITLDLSTANTGSTHASVSDAHTPNISVAFSSIELTSIALLK